MENTPETVLIGSIQKFSVEDGPGIRTTIFIKGCPLSCRWCHNPEMINPRQELMRSPNNCIGCGACLEVCKQDALSMNKEKGLIIDRKKCIVCLSCTQECYARALRPVAKPMTVDEILDAALQDKSFYDKTGGGITVSGGEILMHAAFVSQLIDKAAALQLNACLDTSGFGETNALMELALKENVTDILYDVKSVDDEIHGAYTGVSNKVILKNLRALAANPVTKKKLTIRMPLIGSVNDTETIINETGALFKELDLEKVNLLPYHNLGMGKKRNIGGVQEEFQAPSEERLEEISVYFRNEINMKVDILGRV